MFEARRKRVLEAMGPDAVAVFIGASLATRSNDTEFPFRQDSDFWYLTGFDHPDAVAVLRTDDGPAYTLFVQPRDPDAETWTGIRPGLEGARERYGADEALASDQLLVELPRILERAVRVYHVLGRRADVDRTLVEQQEQLRARTKLGFAPAAELRDPRTITHEMRLFKTEDELTLMRSAADISYDAHHAAALIATPGRWEYELEAELLHVFRRRGASGPAYSSIVGGGKNASILHYVTNDQQLEEGSVVLIDAGAEFQGYASDVTRTYPVGGRFQGPSRDAYEIVLAAQEAAIAAARPGASLPELHEIATRVLVEGMITLGLVSGTVDDVIAQEKHRAYYMHGTSHWLGLDVHDAGVYAERGGSAKTGRKLEPGMVFTVEPGIYVREDDEAAPAELRGLGIRIEDDLVVTAEGHENLNSKIPKRIADVEAWMRDGSREVSPG
jgi:Xaa-Pro aminopeptidase